LCYCNSLVSLLGGSSLASSFDVDAETDARACSCALALAALFFSASSSGSIIVVFVDRERHHSSQLWILPFVFTWRGYFDIVVTFSEWYGAVE